METIAIILAVVFLAFNLYQLKKIQRLTREKENLENRLMNAHRRLESLTGEEITGPGPGDSDLPVKDDKEPIK